MNTTSISNPNLTGYPVWYTKETKTVPRRALTCAGGNRRQALPLGQGGAAAESGQEAGSRGTLGNARKRCRSCDAEGPCSPVHQLSCVAGAQRTKLQEEDVL